jgi:maleylacetoacetate isomerase
MAYRLYTFFRSSASYRVRIALNFKQISYESISKQLRRLEHRAADYLEVNPQGLVPALEHEGRHIPQSLAIIEYLEELEPTPSLLPNSPYDRAIVRAMAQIVACDIHPLCNLRVLQYLKNDLALDETQINDWYRHWVALGLEGLEGLVTQHGGAGPYCFGGDITMADVCLVPQLYNAQRFNCDLTAYPQLRAVAQALQGHPAFEAAHPDLQPDAE